MKMRKQILAPLVATLLAASLTLTAAPEKDIIYSNSFEDCPYSDIPVGVVFRIQPSSVLPSKTRDTVRAVENQPPYGKKSLQIEVPPGGTGIHTQFTLMSGEGSVRPLNLTPDKRYSFSVYAKSDHKNAEVILNHEFTSSKTFTVGTEWERLVFTFTPKTLGAGLTITVKPGARVWLDAVQVEEGDATSFAPAAKTLDPRCRQVAAGGIPRMLPWYGNAYGPLTGLSRSSPLIPADTPRYPVTLITKAPVLDGKFDDECWKDAPTYSIDSPKDGKKGATEFKLVSDGQFFYLAVTCHEPDMKKLVAKQTERNSLVYTDDSLEIFLKSRLNRGEYDHYMLNSLGTCAQEVCGTGIWGQGPGWAAKTSKEGDRWNAEIQFPVSTSSDGMSPDAPYLFNLCRSRVSANEFLPWHGLYHRPETFAALTGIVRPGPLLQETAFDYALGSTADELKVSYRIKNISGKLLDVEPSLMVKRDGKETLVSGNKFALAIDASKELVFTLPFVQKTEKLGVQLQANQAKYRGVEAALDPADLIRGPILQYNVYSPEDKAAAFKFDLFRIGGLLKDASLVLSVKDLFGKMLWEGNLPMTDSVRGEIPLVGLVPGNLIFEASAKSNGKAVASTRFPFQLVNPGGAVELMRADRFRRVMVCGTKPLSGLCGAYINALTFSEAVMDDLKSRGAKFFYVSASHGDDKPLASPSQLRTVLDAAGRRGCKCIVGLNMSKKPVMESESLLQIQEIVMVLKDHSALLAYDLTDEPQKAQIPKMSFASMALQQLDPGHPMTFNLINPKANIKDWSPYQHGLTMLDLYEPTKNVYDNLRDTRRCIPWNAIFFWTTSYNDVVREPSPQEFLSASYAGIVNGTSIVAPFVYKPVSLDLWDAWKTLADEMETIKDALATEDFVDFGNDDGNVGASLRRTGSGTYVIAVTLSDLMSDPPQTVRLALPGLAGKDTVAKVLFEQREVTVKDGVITDVFAPTARHVYLIVP